MKAEGLQEVVLGTEAEPADHTSIEWKTWDAKNSKAQVIFLTSIMPDQLQYLVNCTNAAQMWSKLISIHEQKTDVSKELVWQQFYEYKMPNNLKIATHIANIESLVKKLTDIGEKISQSAICSKVISSLPPKYNSFRTAWDSVLPCQQTFNNLAARLLKEETQMSVSEEETSSLALKVEALQMQLDSYKSQKGSNGVKNKNITELKKRTKCNFCHEKGHWSRECKKRLASKEKGKKNSSSAETAYICDISVFYSLSSSEDQFDWICDSGASMHMTHQKDWFSKISPVEKSMAVKVADNRIIHAIGTGTIEIQAWVDGAWQDRTINNVLYIPELNRSLFSVGAMTDRHFTHYAYQDRCEFRDRHGNISCVGRRSNNLWKMVFRLKPAIECNIATRNSLQLWHERLGHVNMELVKNASKYCNLGCTNFDDFFCEACQFGKQARKTFYPAVRPKAENPGEMIHSDVCGPMNIESPRGSRYFVLFKDDCTGYRQVYFMRHKSEVLDRFKIFEALVSKQTKNQIKILRSDNGTEYTSRQFREFLEKKGIIHEKSAPYSPQQNGRSEREMRTLVECARSMIFNKNVPTELWTEALNTATYVLNRVIPVDEHGISAFEKWFKRKPTLKHMKIFGCKAYMSVPAQLRRKWDPKSQKLMFVGYEGQSENYRLWDKCGRKIHISRNVNFNERISEEDTPNSTVVAIPLTFGNYEDEPEELENHQEEDAREDVSNAEEVPEEIIEPPAARLRNREALRRPDYYGPAVYCSVIEPETYDEAIKQEFSEQWKIAMAEEIDAHQKNGTWKLVPKPENVQVIDTKWVFRVKTDENGLPSRYKARLVARGFTQKQGIDYQDTFAPVVRYDSIRVLLALAVENDFEIAQFDVKTAFLHGKLEEEIYIKQPRGFEDPNAPNSVGKLSKSLYGLKQAPRCWNKTFVNFLSSYNFKQLISDPCVFVGSLDNVQIYLALYVDDGLVMSSSTDLIADMLTNLKERFDITVSDAKIFVGLEMERDREKQLIKVHQRQYVNRILHKFNMDQAKPVSVPAEPGIHLQIPVNQGDNSSKNEPYREAVGSLIFLATVSRPDISYAVSQVSRFLNNWDTSHWQAVKRILRYLKKTKNFSIVYKRSKNACVEGYTDADYAGCHDTRRSTSGYIFMCASGPITWSSQRQSVVALSTTEAEYIALALGAKEAVWLKSFLGEIGMEQNSITVYVDNQSAIKLAHNPEYHKRTKHIDIRYHFVREVCDSGKVQVSYIETKRQLADFLTKPLSKNLLENFVSKCFAIS